jgi:hypothetical protein
VEALESEMDCRLYSVTHVSGAWHQYHDGFMWLVVCCKLFVQSKFSFSVYGVLFLTITLVSSFEPGHFSNSLHRCKDSVLCR